MTPVSQTQTVVQITLVWQQIVHVVYHAGPVQIGCRLYDEQTVILVADQLCKSYVAHFAERMIQFVVDLLM